MADRGSLRTGKKSVIVDCIKAPAGRADSARLATVVVLDMAAVVHMVRPTPAKTFTDYATQHIVPFLEYQITPTVERIYMYDTTRKTTTNHSRISVVVHVHGLGFGMATLKFRSTSGTVDSLNTRKTKRSYSLSSVTISSRMIYVGNSF